MNKNKLLQYFLLATFLSPIRLGAQVFWAAGYTENLGVVTNGQILIQPFEDEVLAQNFNSSVQFEATMAGAYRPNGQLLFYTNGCHVYGADHQILSGGEGLNPGEVFDMACDAYGYLAPKGASVATFRIRPDLYFLIHTGMENSTTHSISYGPLYLPRIVYDTLSGEVTVLSKNEVLINTEVDPFELVRHANGNDWWLLTNDFGTSNFHKILLTPDGPAIHEVQSVGYNFPFPPCRWQRSLSASPSGERLVRFSSKCGAQFLTFDRCSGILSEAGFSHLENGVFGGSGSAFSSDSESVYFSRWYQVSKARFDTPPDTLRASFTPPTGYGGSFVHMFRDPYGRIFIAPQASEPYLHVIEPSDNVPNVAQVQFEGFAMPSRIQRTIPHYPNYNLGSIANSPCDTLLISSAEDVPKEPARLRLYPNPAKDIAVIEMDFSGHKHLTLYDALGRPVRSLESTDLQAEMSLEGLPAGVYYLQAVQDGRHFGKVRVLKL